MNLEMVNLQLKVHKQQNKVSKHNLVHLIKLADNIQTDIRKLIFQKG